MKAANKLSLLAITAMTPLSAALQGRTAFVSTPSHTIGKLSKAQITTRPFVTPSFPPTSPIQTTATTTTSLGMGFNLPPSPKSPLEELESLLPAIGTGLLVALFFASPLGSIFFAIFNSFFVLALLTPFVLFVGFQLWTTFYTVEAPCPSCGVLPVRAIKNDERDPTMCLNCGALSRVNESGDGLELCNNPRDMMNDDMMGGNGASLFDQLFGNGGNGMSDFTSDFGRASSSDPKKDDPVKRAKRQNTIIDVDVERD